jgi:hypothetical protein
MNNLLTIIKDMDIDMEMGMDAGIDTDMTMMMNMYVHIHVLCTCSEHEHLNGTWTSTQTCTWARNIHLHMVKDTDTGHGHEKTESYRCRRNSFATIFKQSPPWKVVILAVIWITASRLLHKSSFSRDGDYRDDRIFAEWLSYEAIFHENRGETVRIINPTV